ncbi:PRD domain-containing protein [Lactococcus hircilactis]|uniref:PRD domain-containing protein n=1 Tax=Lactococcus hircilactis TaxID=1494462 RepID=A0A7X1Z842_9LACT|nr:PRD domain-containing protein [Lactococcus hircilactis]MQW39583.1 PRD domain-containing protein [Lactococcus hircilactis]
MRILKIFNNNALLVEDDDHHEKFVMGKGIGFKKKPGESVDGTMIQKVFSFQKKSVRDSLLEIYEQLPSEEIDLISDLIKEAETEFHQTYFVSLYVSLADHIHYAITRTREGIEIKNPLTWEVRKFYAKEFALSRKYVQKINQVLDVKLHEDEAAAIALHFVNARQENSLYRNTYEITHLIDDILKIVRLYYHIDYDEDSLSFQRFVTHLHYLGQRILNGNASNQIEDQFLFKQVQRKYPHASQCVEKITYYLRQSRSVTLDTDEIAYLTLHIQRLFDEIEEKKS